MEECKDSFSGPEGHVLKLEGRFTCDPLDIMPENSPGYSAHSFVLVKYFIIKHFLSEQGQSFKTPDGAGEVPKLEFSIRGE